MYVNGEWVSNNVGLRDLVGETLTNIDVGSDDRIMLMTASGREFILFHDQCCCESVSIEGTDGEWKDLIGKVLVDVSEETEDASSLEEWGYPESATRTTITFLVDGATVVNRWFGSSNGYYSESVNFAELKKQVNKQLPNHLNIDLQTGELVNV